jgi:hypothetical protein
MGENKLKRLAQPRQETMPSIHRTTVSESLTRAAEGQFRPEAGDCNRRPIEECQLFDFPAHPELAAGLKRNLRVCLH